MSQLLKRKSTQYESLLQRMAKENPRLYDILKMMAADIKGIIDIVDPLEATVQRIQSGATAKPAGPSLFVYSLAANAVVFTWATEDSNVRFFELRKGTVWSTGEFVLRSSSLSAAVDPLPTGSTYYMLKTLSGTFTPCDDAEIAYLNVEVPELGQPSVSAQVIDNNVLLNWTVPSSSFAIDHYNLYRDSIKFAELSGNFTVRFEAASNTYEYGVEAVDVAGNVGPRGLVEATVRQPPDYVLEDSRSIDLSTVTATNALYENEYIIACVDVTETYQAHFTSESWADPEDQVTAGYERYIQENLLTGDIVDEHDYGSIIENTIVSVNYVKEIFSGTNDVTVTIQMDVSDDGIVWAGYTSGASQFFESFRYLRVKLVFTATDDDSMIRVSNVTVAVSIKREVDSGYALCDSGDSGGTTVNFNKAFKDVDSVTATCDDVEPIYVVVKFVDIPNPTSFALLAFDSSGQRVTKTVKWKARGIV